MERGHEEARGSCFINLGFLLLSYASGVGTAPEVQHYICFQVTGISKSFSSQASSALPLSTYTDLGPRIALGENQTSPMAINTSSTLSWSSGSPEVSSSSPQVWLPTPPRTPRQPTGCRQKRSYGQGRSASSPLRNEIGIEAQCRVLKSPIRSTRSSSPDSNLAQGTPFSPAPTRTGRTKRKKLEHGQLENEPTKTTPRTGPRRVIDESLIFFTRKAMPLMRRAVSNR